MELTKDGGYGALEQRLDVYLQKSKVSLFVQRVTSEEIAKGSPLFDLLKKLRLSRSRAVTVEKVVQRKFDAVNAILKLSWEELGIQKPRVEDLSEEEL